MATKKKPAPAGDDEGLMIPVAKDSEMYLYSLPSIASLSCWESEYRCPLGGVVPGSRLIAHLRDSPRLAEHYPEISVIMWDREKVRELLRGGCYWRGPKHRLEARGQTEGAPSEDGIVSPIYLWVMADEPGTSKNQLGLNLLNNQE